MRKTFVLIVAACGLLLAGIAHAQTTAGGYPNRPVKVIVPFAPSGPTDVTARIVAQKLSDLLGQQFYIENQAGAGGNIGMGNAAKAAPDGYTILFVSSSFVVNPSLYPKIPYDPYKDFIPITNVADAPNLLIVNPSVPANSVKELIALIKSHPGTYSFASAGTGTTPHLSGELFKLASNLDIVHVPFGGAGPAVQSTVGGHTPIAFTSLPPSVPMVRAGKLRALAVSSTTRSATLPDVPTMEESGLTGQEADTFQAMLVPAGTPKAVTDLLYQQVVKIVGMPDVKQRFAELGFDAVANTPEEFAAQIKIEIAKWGKVIKEASIKVE